MRFSERIGKRQPKVEIQLDSMDKDLKNRLWNSIYDIILEPTTDQIFLKYTPNYHKFIKKIWGSFLKIPIDILPEYPDVAIKNLKAKYDKLDYLETYDLIDFIGENLNFDKQKFIDSCNKVLIQELSGYRFINNHLAPIILKKEIEEIESVIENSKSSGLSAVHAHITSGLRILSDKKNPDYRNSIKESISAVESICQVITGDSKAELGKALKKLKQKISIHGALEQGFIKLYGYTSDGEGIRHAMSDESNLDLEDAQYMIITCSAFINYLIVKMNKAGINTE